MKKEIKIIILISIITLFLVNLPILYFSLFPKERYFFLGRNAINSQETYPNISFIEQSKQGKNLLENLYTTEKQTPTLIKPLYWFIGKTAKLVSISSVVAYHVSRIILSIIFFLVLYKFLLKIFPNSRQKLICYTFVLLASGLGVFVHTILPTSSDLSIPESNTFLSLADAPHLILSQILMLAGFNFFLNFMNSKKKTISILIMTFSFLFLGFEYPISTIVVIPVILILVVIKKKNYLYAILVGLLTLLVFLIQKYGIFSNPTLLSPSPLSYITGFGLLLPLGIIGAESFLKRKDTASYLVLIWTTIGFILVYGPFPFQKGLATGLHIPITILATSGFLTLSQKIKKEWKQIFFGLIITILPLTSLYAIYNNFSEINKDIPSNYYYSITTSEYRAFEWLKNNSSSKDTILSNWFYGNIIPGLTGRKIYIGHKVQTKDFDTKVQKTDTFLLNTNTTSSLEYLQENNISYIFLGSNDAMLKYGFKPNTKSFLQKVYSKDDISIYKVIY